jgi:hypothetical protein
VYITAQATAGSCSGNDLRVGVSLSVDGAWTQDWHLNPLYVRSNATTSFADVVVSVGPGAHSLAALALQASSTGCTVTVSDIMIGVVRQS